MITWGGVRQKVLEEIKKKNPELREKTANEKLEELLKEKINEGIETSFFIVDLGNIIRKYEEWNRCLPRVKPFYAIKCSPDDLVCKVLHMCGAGFDCASRDEIQKMLALGVSPKDIIFANPCKPKAHIKYAVENGIRTMTFDNISELYKINELFPGGKYNRESLQLVLRILPDDSHSTMPFGSKFGASYKDCLKLLTLAKELDLNVVGVSFHVGSGCYSAEGYINTIRMAKKSLKKLKKKVLI